MPSRSVSQLIQSFFLKRSLQSLVRYDILESCGVKREAFEANFVGRRILQVAHEG
jgi:hypothetical protein